MKRSINGAHPALLLLLGINLFNYIDRQILAALEPDIRAPEVPAHLPDVVGRVVFEDVSFAYLPGRIDDPDVEPAQPSRRALRDVRAGTRA